MTFNGAVMLEAVGLRIEANLGKTTRTIVRALEVEVAAGETVGIVGESGSGKSLTARALIGLLPPGVHAQGRVSLDGQDLLTLNERSLRQIRGSSIALLLQDPFTMLNPLLTVGRQIMETAPRGGGRAEAIRRLAEVGIHDQRVADQYPFQLSGGMQQRVAIAAAIASDPQFLIADEPSTALDVTTQKEILDLLLGIQEARGMGLVLITHDLRLAFSICRRIYVLYAGTLLEVAEGTTMERQPLHPYTLGLLLSEPSVERRLDKLTAIEGSVPSPDEVAGRCPFSPRCQWAAPECSEGDPPLLEVGEGRRSACVRIHEIRGELEHTRRESRSRPHVPVVELERRTSPLIRVDQLVKRFAAGKRHGEVHALTGVSIEVGEGESVGLVGESGSGKTTLARCVVGLETPSAGRISIDGIDASDYQRLDADRRRQLRRCVQMVFQDPYSSLNPVRTVGATLREAIAVGPDPTASVTDLLERVGLSGTYEVRKPVALSGGERQRVALARSLAVRPRVIVCDEPVSALDVSVQAQILNLLGALREELGLSYLFITHDLAVVRQVVDRVYVLFRGEIVEEGPVDRVLDAPTHPYTARLVDSAPRLQNVG